MRYNLINARKQNNLSVHDMCIILDVKERMYRYMESGERTGIAERWDKLEELFGIPQKQLRAITTPSVKQAI